MAAQDTPIVRKPLYRAGHNADIEHKTVNVVAASILAAGTALMLDAATGNYVIAEIAVPGSGNLRGWSILLEEVAIGTFPAEILTAGVVDEEDVILEGAVLTTMTEDAKVVFNMNGIKIAYSKLT